MRTKVNKVFEMARGGKLIGASLDVKVYLCSSNVNLLRRFHEMFMLGDDVDKLHRIFITSQVEVLASIEHTSSTGAAYTGIYYSMLGELWIGVSCADGAKCKSCWIFSQVVGSFVDHPTVCEKCYKVISNIDSASPKVVMAA